MTGKKIKLWELVMLNWSAIYGIRWIARSVSDGFGLGTGAMAVWFIFMLVFFIPQALMCGEMSATYNTDGSVSDWVSDAFGVKWGFMVSWLRWTSVIFWYGGFLTFLSINLTYMVGRPDLASSKTFVLVMSLIVIWAASLISIKGMELGKYFTNTGSLGSIVPTVFLIAFAFIAVFALHNAPANVYTVETMTPKINMTSLVGIASCIFAYTGAEIGACYVTEMENPKKDFPKAIIISAVLICLFYIIGSFSITMLLPASEVYGSTGILDALTKGAELLGLPNIVVQILAAGISLATLAAILLYISFPIKLLFGNAEKGLFSESITKNNEHAIPTKAIIVQAIIITVLLVGTSFLPTVEVMYNILIMMTSLSCLFPCVLMFMAYISFKKRNITNDTFMMSKNRSWCLFLGYLCLVINLIAIVLSALPVMGNFHDNLIYELELVGGCVVVIFVGLWIWKRSGLPNRQIDLLGIKKDSDRQ